MKWTIALVMTLLCVGVYAAADDSALVSADIARVKSLSLDAIKAKYPTNDLSALQYTGFTAIASTNDEIVLSVTFLVLNSGTTEDLNNNGHLMTKKKQMTYAVTLDNLGNVRDVSTGSSISIESSSRRKAANQPSEGTHYDEMRIQTGMSYEDVTCVLSNVGARVTVLQSVGARSVTEKVYELPNGDIVVVKASARKMVESLDVCCRDIQRGKMLGTWEVVDGVNFRRSQNGNYAAFPWHPILSGQAEPTNRGKQGR